MLDLVPSQVLEKVKRWPGAQWNRDVDCGSWCGMLGILFNLQINVPPHPNVITRIELDLHAVDGENQI